MDHPKSGAGICAAPDQDEELSHMPRKSAIGILVTVSSTLALAGMIVVVVHQRNQLSALRTANETLQAESGERDRWRAENQPAQPLRHQETELQQLRENTRELARLRNEVRQLREQAQELAILRAANAQLLQAVQASSSLPTNQLAFVAAARRQGSILGANVISANDPSLGAGGRAGVLVTGLVADPTPTESSLKSGDLIYALDGRAIENVAQLQTEMMTRKPGETVLVDVLRGKETLRLQVKTRPWPEPR